MGKGIEIRERSIRLSFTVEGVRHRPTLMLDGEALLPTTANVKYAHRHLGDVRDAIKHKRFCMAEFFPASGSGLSLTVGEQLDTWLAGLRIEASTRAGYGSAVTFWQETIGKIAVRALKLSDCLTALASRPLLTGKTVNNYVLVLRQALDLAVLDKVLTENPAKHIPRAKHQKPPVDPFTAGEAEAILANMQEHYDAQVANYAEVKFFSGMRTSES
ncbi:MAG: DUF3596 domain-containing protein, partial [Pseudomonadota bacterium]|nr:DUF3596 domain-containing protein [Pseudomonadota bacterium]